jgi:hypothetical protein
MWRDAFASVDRSTGWPEARNLRYAAIFLLAVLSLSRTPEAEAANMPASSTTEERAALDAKISTLRANAAKHGSVRVIVSVAPSEGGGRDAIDIDAVKAQLVERLRGPDAPIIEPIEGTPYVVMELTPGGVERLASDSAVRTLQEDRPERAQ